MPVKKRTRLIVPGIVAVAGCLGDFLLWMIVLPAAVAFLALVFLEPDLFAPAVVIGIVVLIVVAVFVVLLTATLGYLRAQQAAIERQLRDERDSSAERSPRS